MPSIEEREEVKSLIPDGMKLDEQVAVFHCRHGRNNNRLYIKKIESGWLYNCFHCGISGIIHSEYESARSIKERLDKRKADCSSTHKSITLPSDFTTSIPYVDKENLLQWITGHEIKTYNFGYSEKAQRVIVPLYKEGTLQAMLYKRSRLYPQYPKEVIKSSAEWHRHHVIRCGGDSGVVVDTLVVVEDFLSGIVVGRKNPAVVLFGTNMNESTMLTITNISPKRIVVWLDNDNMQVKMKQQHIFNRLSLLFPTTICKLGDPKRYYARTEAC